MKTILVAMTLMLGLGMVSCSDTSKAKGTAPAVTEYTKKSGSIPVVNGRGDTIDVKYTCEGCEEVPLSEFNKAIQSHSDELKTTMKQPLSFGMFNVTAKRLKANTHTSDLCWKVSTVFIAKNGYGNELEGFSEYILEGDRQIDITDELSFFSMELSASIRIGKWQDTGTYFFRANDKDAQVDYVIIDGTKYDGGEWGLVEIPKEVFSSINDSTEVKLKFKLRSYSKSTNLDTLEEFTLDFLDMSDLSLLVQCVE